MRYVVPLAIFFFACGALALTYCPAPDWGSASQVPDYTMEEMNAIADRTELHEQRLQSLHRFRSRMQVAKADLRMGQRTLGDAVDAIHAAAAADSQIVLRVLAQPYPNLPSRERLAVLLISHISVEASESKSSIDTERLDALESELKRWPDVTSETLIAASDVRDRHDRWSKQNSNQPVTNQQ